jgi:hypothetical protein
VNFRTMTRLWVEAMRRNSLWCSRGSGKPLSHPFAGQEWLLADRVANQ